MYINIKQIYFFTYYITLYRNTPSSYAILYCIIGIIVFIYKMFSENIFAFYIKLLNHS